MTCGEDEDPGSWLGFVLARSARREEMKASGDLWKDRDSERALKGIFVEGGAAIRQERPNV